MVKTAFQYPLIAPSILSANYCDLQHDIDLCLSITKPLWLHCDIMDGHFVPNISFGSGLVYSLYNRYNDKVFLDVHLMVQHPEQYINVFRDSGAKYITVHVEVATHLHKVIHDIKSHNMRCGVALNPSTPISLLEGCIEYVDMILIMSVNPGYGGQRFIPQSLKKIQQLHRMRQEYNLSFLIQVDGGVNSDNIESLVKHGADVLVAGNSIFGNDKIGHNYKLLQEKCKLYRMC